MKKSVLTFLLFVLFLPVAFSQNGADGGFAIKRMEHKFRNNVTVVLPNGKTDGVHNLYSKTDLEKLFFGDFNARIEFFISPSFKDATGFRIVRDSSDKSYVIELRFISNFEEVEKQMKEEFPSIGIPLKLFSSMPDDIGELIKEHNIAMSPKRKEAELKRYTIATLSFPVSDLFVEKLHAKFVVAIDNFKAEGEPVAFLDGTTITFRCIVEDEVWTLAIYEPRGDIRGLSDFCRQITADARMDKFDEPKYIEWLQQGEDPQIP